MDSETVWSLIHSFSFLGNRILIQAQGMTSSTCGVFQAEACRSDRRGKLSVIVVLHNVIFYCTATWLTLACSFLSGGYQWRLPLALQVLYSEISYASLPCKHSSTFLVELSRMMLTNEH